MKSPIKGLTCLAMAAMIMAPVSAVDEDIVEADGQSPAEGEVAITLLDEPVEAYAIRAPDDMGVIGFDAATVAFGDVEAGSLLEHSYYFMNNGFGPLTVNRGFSQVSGVSVRISNEPIAPEEVGEVRVNIDTSGMEGDQFIRIHVQTDAFNGPDSTLYARFTVWPVGELPEETENASENAEE